MPQWRSYAIYSKSKAVVGYMRITSLDCPASAVAKSEDCRRVLFNPPIVWQSKKDTDAIPYGI